MSNNTVTIDHILSLIVDEDYQVFQNTTLTVCVLTLKNGFTVTGESACADPANFSFEKGMKYAKEKAIEKIWLLEGYLLRQRLYEEDIYHSNRRVLAEQNQGVK